jgi:hypothetical protein
MVGIGFLKNTRYLRKNGGNFDGRYYVTIYKNI